MTKMTITKKNIPIRDLVKGYKNDGFNGVTGYGGKLDIRPAYQREFVYNDKQRDAVIGTVRKGFPLNVIYWADDGNGKLEVLDGQQRILSICDYIAARTDGEDGTTGFAIEGEHFHNLFQNERDEILDYELDVYVCSGDPREKLEWFRVINIAGAVLTDQELRNANYTGPWLSDAKRYFSNPNSGADKLGKGFYNAKVNRQELLEKVIIWKANSKKDDDIQTYMGNRQRAKDAQDEWNYFMDVIDWAKGLFGAPVKAMRNVEWGFLYNKYGKNKYNPQVLQAEVLTLMADNDVTKKSGIYPYIFSRDEKYLSIRAFDDNIKQQVYAQQKGICPVDGKHYSFEEMEADHITPWSQGGKTIASNCQMLSKEANRRKSNK